MSANEAKWEPVIGLEIHVQLSTRSKIFSGAATAYGAPPNTQACVIDLGFPGVLPVLNEEAVLMAIKFGLAIDASISARSIFARKNYFYPDLPKGYQISQYEMPIVHDGFLRIDLEDAPSKRIGITRAHLEEDAGKSLHADFEEATAIDLNRAGIPLLEVVSEPDLRSAREAVAYMKKIHTLVRYLEICDGNMQEGSLRCDANVSVRLRGAAELGTRTELKNLNSFRFVERAIAYEIERQTEILEDGGKIAQETRLYDPDAHQTRPMRGKEEAHDYRYFPDPDLLPVLVPEDLVRRIRASLPELPDAKRARFEAEHELSAYDAAVLTASRALADYFEEVVGAVPGALPKTCANWVMGELSAALNKEGIGIEESPVSASELARLIARVADHTISGKIAKAVFDAMWAAEGTADEIIESRGLRQVTDSTEIERTVEEVMGAHPAQVEEYRAGAEKVFGYLMGQVMKRSGGRANPQRAKDMLSRKLSGD